MSGSRTAEDTTEAIMRATYRALCRHGYPATSISRIADEFEKSKSLLYYHYEDKEDLLGDFLRYLLDQFEAELARVDDEEPYDHLLAVVQFLLPREMTAEQLRFRRALLEIRSQAPYHEAYHEQLRRTDELVIDELARAIERGVETGDFRPVNARETAEFLYSTAHGAVGRGVTLDDVDVVETNRESIVDYVDSQLRRYA